MLAAVGGAALSYAVGKLGDFGIEKLGVSNEVHSNVARLSEELEFMQSLMEDAEENQGGDHRVQRWVCDVTQIANETVSVLDKFHLKIGGTEDPTHLGGVRSLMFVAEIAEQINSIFKRVKDLARRRKSYGIPNIGSAAVGESNASVAAKSLRRTTPYTDMDQLFVGLEDVKRELLGELLKADCRRCMVSIYGIGGSGKTNLARSLYNSDEVLSSFTHRAWTYVSQEYTITDILQRVIKSLENISWYDKKLERMGEEDLEFYLREKLGKSKYFVVIDDVWDRIAWERLKKSFPEGVNGSRIIITTRNKDVATRLDKRIYAHELRLLDPNESLELVLRKLCPGNENEWPVWCSPDMEALGGEMVTKCGGLPLALVVLGGLLAYKQSSTEWQKVREQIWRHLTNDSIEISFLFSLSYNDLSMDLKRCFLYVGTFPEDYRIYSTALSFLWMAEGFITGGEMEDIAASQLNELVNRNLIVEEEHWGVQKFYKIHDLLRNHAIVKASEIKLFDIFNPNSSIHRIRSHVVSTPNIQRYATTDHYNAKLQSLIMYNNHGEENTLTSQLIARLGKFKDLRILKLIKFETPPELLSTIEDLLQLKYLKLRSTDARIDLPPSIGNLRRLQTLEVDGGSCNLPSEISNLRNLRHLACKRIEGNVAGIANLLGLQTLRRTSYEHWTTIQSSENLVNLKDLWIQDIKEQNGEACSLESIVMLKSLHTLGLSCSYGDKGFPAIDFISSLHNLSALILNGKIEMLPPPEKWPKKLTLLTLYNSKLEEDPIPTIEKLSNLKRLNLWSSHETASMSFSSKCLPQLEHLSFCYLFNLKKVEVGEGAMPIIKRLYIHECCELEDNITDRLKSIIIHGEPW